MDIFSSSKTHLKLLLVSNLDVNSAYLLSERFVPSNPKYDCILCCGPFHPAEPPPVPRLKAESDAIALGDIAAMLAAVENIVCRVIYLPSDVDPPTLLLDTVHLTPNSVNLYARRINLLSGLFATGYSEIANDKVEESQEDWEQLGVEAVGTRIIGPTELDISDLLSIGTQKANQVNQLSGVEASSKPCGIFALNYVYAHTLNQILFHKAEELRQAGISLCIVNQTSNDTLSPPLDTSKFPMQIGDLTVISPFNIIKDKKFISVELDWTGEKWTVGNTSIESL